MLESIAISFGKSLMITEPRLDYNFNSANLVDLLHTIFWNHRWAMRLINWQRTERLVWHRLPFSSLGHGGGCLVFDHQPLVHTTIVAWPIRSLHLKHGVINMLMCKWLSLHKSSMLLKDTRPPPNYYTSKIKAMPDYRKAWNGARDMERNLAIGISHAWLVEMRYSIMRRLQDLAHTWHRSEWSWSETWGSSPERLSPSMPWSLCRQSSRWRQACYLGTGSWLACQWVVDRRQPCSDTR